LGPRRMADIQQTWPLFLYNPFVCAHYNIHNNVIEYNTHAHTHTHTLYCALAPRSRTALSPSARTNKNNLLCIVYTHIRAHTRITAARSLSPATPWLVVRHRRRLLFATSGREGFFSIRFTIFSVWIIRIHHVARLPYSYHTIYYCLSVSRCAAPVMTTCV